MSLLKYVKKISATNDGLPTPGGSLDGVLPPEAIISANEFVRHVTTSNPATKKRGKYQILSAE